MSEFERILARLTEEADGVSPTFREIAAAMGVSTNAAQLMADRLIVRGRLRKMRYARNSLQLVGDAS
jgi:hypothetical protein